MADVAIERLGKRFATPVVLASGPAGFGLELSNELRLSDVGAVTMKTITLEAMQGNPQPRLVDCPSGALNSIGMENPGVAAFLARIAPRLGELPTRRILSIAASTVDELATLLTMIENHQAADTVDAVELNLSCPNIEGRRIGADAELVREYVRAARQSTERAVLAKLPGDTGNLLASADAALSAGAGGLTLINTLLGMRIDRSVGRPFLHRTYGGFCGPAILPIALARVYEAREAFPEAVIVGTGGVVDLGGMIEMLLAGADLVGVGFGMMADPELPQRLRADLGEWLDMRGYASVEEIIGAAHRGGYYVR